MGEITIYGKVAWGLGTARSSISLVLLFACAIFGVGALSVASADTVRVSTSSAGTQSNGPVVSNMLINDQANTINSDGQFVGYMSAATNLVANDTNGVEDIFRKNVSTGETVRASVATDGAQSNGSSSYPATSSDGRYIVFSSFASNLVVNDTNGAWDVFVRDFQTGQTERVSTDSAGVEGAGGSGEYFRPAISADGRYVAFTSQAMNLVNGDSNGVGDVFVKDRQTGETVRASTDGAEAQLSAYSYSQSVSADGRRVAFTTSSAAIPSDTNSSEDIYVKDLDTGELVRASTASDGTEADGYSYNQSISGDGDHVAFISAASNLVADDTNGSDEVFVKNLTTGVTVRASTAADGSQSDDPSDGGGLSVPQLSGSGRYVTFYSNANGLVPDPESSRYEVFLKDLQAGDIERVSVGTSGTLENGASLAPAISADARYVSFVSAASNLVANDTNGVTDVFRVRTFMPDPGPGPTPDPTPSLPDNSTPSGSGPSQSSDNPNDPTGFGQPNSGSVGATKRLVIRRVKTTVRKIHISLAVPESGTVQVRATARRHGGKRFTVARSSKMLNRGGGFVLSKRVTKAAKRALGKKRMVVTFKVTFKPRTGTALAASKRAKSARVRAHR